MESQPCGQAFFHFLAQIINSENKTDKLKASLQAADEELSTLISNLDPTSSGYIQMTNIHELCHENCLKLTEENILVLKKYLGFEEEF